MLVVASLFDDGDLQSSILAKIGAYAFLWGGAGLFLIYLSCRLASTLKRFHGWLFRKFPERVKPPTFMPAYRLISVNLMGFSLFIALLSLDLNFGVGTWVLGLFGIVRINSNDVGVT